MLLCNIGPEGLLGGAKPLIQKGCAAPKSHFSDSASSRRSIANARLRVSEYTTHGELHASARVAPADDTARGGWGAALGRRAENVVRSCTSAMTPFTVSGNNRAVS
ncbi:hypothetical protein AB8807_14435 [Xanthomonas campestris pv. olitorii]|uniref:hypothetical protein n=1 Tax=Xanthomonas euvesicatoria TaxID=456327 RepID=UPI001C4494E9|nr:hypothetical protein [Xanthomonas euvesicatoria]MBV6799862.1 hypothetical protein [Xanthomonas campestris pv. obscurae]WVK02786.1 hypothetical protein KWH09_14385 [Xanthomonas campestris pv. olitorii]